METVDRSPATRKSLPLSERDLRDLAVLRGSEAHRAALAELTHVHISETTSEAVLLQTVLEAGLKAVADLVEADGYARIAHEVVHEDRQAVARRRRPSWADE
ncbi:hypothetical protein GCM10029976_085070 [Kribbella albertanoniae]|uniref:Uncharacterized protein n=1 Tax=Kribbella albertanoniae TaxID=1266829 RepID=A0A4R4Q1V5_9ACTN|nr:hypothetical protein [Kribbella albertanoniae]TDC28976.1 hypothetical protein E1261_16845 [Kribbella albertanoniae]